MAGDIENLRKYLGELSHDHLRAYVRDLTHSDLVDLWDELDESEALVVFLALGKDARIDLITALPQAEQEALVGRLPMQNMQELLAEMDPDDLVDLIQALSSDVRGQVWNSLTDEAREETRFLLQFDEDDAAGLMTPRYLAVRRTLTVRQTIDFVRRGAKDVETVYYVYVLDPLKRLLGVVSLRVLLSASDDARVEDVMVRRPVTVTDETDQEEVARVLEAYDLLAVPVVDEHRRMLGIVTFDDVMDVVREEHTEDVYRMGAMEGSTDAYTQLSVWKLIRKRIPWLIILLLAGTITTNVLNGFQGYITVAAFLAWFVPVITQTGGNSGTQSSTLMISGLATHDLEFRDIGKVILKELVVGLLMGIILGGVIVLRSVFLPPGIEWIEAVAVGASMVFVVLFSSIVGAAAPLLIHRLGLDPTVMAGPLMATIIDVAGLTIYFHAARLILGL